MCGIVGVLRPNEPVLGALVEGLRVLEYRGYDSVGLGVLVGDDLVISKRAGRIDDLEKILADGSLQDVRAGIGHSRWATHGPPTDINAHPHRDAAGRIALVHNGIIENYLELRSELTGAGDEFLSETDTEVLAHLVGREVEAGYALEEALRRALDRVHGYYATAVLMNSDSPEIVCAREGPPLCVAVTEGGAYLGSDVLALLPHTRDVCFLEDGDVAILSPGKMRITDRAGNPVDRPIRHIEWDSEEADLGGYAHFMLKEIHEQPDVVARTMQGKLDAEAGDVRLEGEVFSDEALRAIDRVQIVACGTALHAGHVAKYLIEGLARIPVDVDFASEFRYRDPALSPNPMVLGISQSGETADTLAALRLAISRGAEPICLCNSIGSTMMRESEASIQLEAGPEIGVASTKAFVAMVVASMLLAIRLGRARGTLSVEDGRACIADLKSLRAALEHMLARSQVQRIQRIAEEHANAKGFIFLGRGINYPIALEGALKLKEISYVHAEGYPAGAMKHGPIALIEPGMTTVALASKGDLADKVRSNIEQVRARGGHVIVIGSAPECLAVADEAVDVPHISRWMSPILNVVPLQLFSYHIALARGCDIDKPRNLAKSVTVE